MATAVAQITPAGALPEAPVDPVISPSARKSSCASTEAPDEQRANQEEVQVEDNERYPVDELCQRTACELHKPIGNITMKVYINLIIRAIISTFDACLRHLITSSFLYIYIGGIRNGFNTSPRTYKPRHADSSWLRLSWFGGDC